MITELTPFAGYISLRNTIPGFGSQLLAGKEGKKLNSAEQFLAGFGAGVLEAIFAVTPIETVKTKAIQTNSPFLTGVRTILKTEGPAGLYQGVWATIAKQGSNQVRWNNWNIYFEIITRRTFWLVNSKKTLGIIIFFPCYNIGNRWGFLRLKSCRG